MLCCTTSAVSTSSTQDRHPVGVLEVDREAALAAVAAQGDVGRVPEAVPQGVDLDDVGAEVGEHLGAERAGDGEAEIEHTDPGERRAEHLGRPSAATRATVGSGAARSFGANLVRVLADRRRRTGDRSRDAVELVDDADLADRPELGVDRRGRRSRRRAARRRRAPPRANAPAAARTPTSAPTRDPVGRRELGEGCGELRVVVVQDDESLPSSARCGSGPGAAR